MAEVVDYSLKHQFLGSLEGSGGEHQLSDEQVNNFWRDGFLAGVPVLSDNDCDKLLEEVDAIRGGTHPGHHLLYEFHSNQTGSPDKVLMHSLGHWRLEPGLHDLAFLPNIVEPASRLLVQGQQVGVRLWHDQLFVKPPKTGSVVAWHQDYSYWTRSVPMQHLTVHIALDDQDEENGCIHYIPGSHRWTREGGPLPVLDFDFKDLEGIKTILTPEELEMFKPVPIKLKRGEAVFHHPLAVHGSLENKSERWRRAAVMNFMADGTRSAFGGSLLQGVPSISMGERIEGQCFPIVYQPTKITFNSFQNPNLSTH